jgi:hypothetical protein
LNWDVGELNRNGGEVARFSIDCEEMEKVGQTIKKGSRMIGNAGKYILKENQRRCAHFLIGFCRD